MAGHTPWREVRARRGPDTPERQAARDAIQRAMDEALRLAQLREADGKLPSELADPADSLEDHGASHQRRDDLYLTTLRGYVETMGGRLILHAVFPDRTIDVPLLHENAEAGHTDASRPAALAD